MEKVACFQIKCWSVLHIFKWHTNGKLLSLSCKNEFISLLSNMKSYMLPLLAKEPPLYGLRIPISSAQLCATFVDGSRYFLQNIPILVVNIVNSNYRHSIAWAFHKMSCIHLWSQTCHFESRIYYFWWLSRQATEKGGFQKWMPMQLEQLYVFMWVSIYIFK